MTLALTLVPSLIIVGIFIYSDKFTEPGPLIFQVFFLGVALCIPAGYLNDWLIWSRHQPEFYTFLAAITEEPLKFLVLYLFLKNRTEFNEPMDAIVYGTLVSLGFATLENLQYVYFFDADVAPVDIAILRALSAIPMHAACGVLMGHFFGKYVFKGSKLTLSLSLAIPICLHGSYNFLTTFSPGSAFLLLILMLLACDLLHRRAIAAQKIKLSEEEEKSV